MFSSFLRNFSYKGQLLCKTAKNDFKIQGKRFWSKIFEMCFSLSFSKLWATWRRSYNKCEAQVTTWAEVAKNKLRWKLVQIQKCRSGSWHLYVTKHASNILNFFLPSVTLRLHTLQSVCWQKYTFPTCRHQGVLL